MFTLTHTEPDSRPDNGSAEIHDDEMWAMIHTDADPEEIPGEDPQTWCSDVALAVDPIGIQIGLRLPGGQGMIPVAAVTRDTSTGAIEVNIAPAEQEVAGSRVRLTGPGILTIDSAH